MEHTYNNTIMKVKTVKKYDNANVNCQQKNFLNTSLAAAAGILGRPTSDKCTTSPFLFNSFTTKSEYLQNRHC
jgi:hypothetical protein